MKYYYFVSSETIKDIKDRISHEFTKEDGWNIDFKLDSNETLKIYILSAPYSIYDPSINYKEIKSCGLNEEYSRIKFIAEGHDLPVQSQCFVPGDLEIDTDKQNWMVKMYQGSPKESFKLSEINFAG